MAETTTTETTRQRSQRTGSPEFHRGCGASRTAGFLALRSPSEAAQARPPAPGIGRSDAQRRSPVAQMHWHTALVSLTLKILPPDFVGIGAGDGALPEPCRDRRGFGGLRRRGQQAHRPSLQRQSHPETRSRPDHLLRLQLHHHEPGRGLEHGHRSMHGDLPALGEGLAPPGLASRFGPLRTEPPEAEGR